MRWLRNEERENGPKGPIRFGISVRMNPKLKGKMLQLPDSLWKPYAEEADGDQGMDRCEQLLARGR